MSGKWTLGVVLSAILLLGSASVNEVNCAERIWRLGWFDLSQTPSTPYDLGSRNLQAFREGMRDLGYLETRDYVIEPRFADTDRSRLPRLAKELVDAGVDMIVTVGTPTTVAAAKATGTIPIVMTGADPIGRGVDRQLGASRRQRYRTVE
jgi:putative ABC transport system substrate-binding protein